MQIDYGKDHHRAKAGQYEPVRGQTSKLINPHALILGSSGAGKSYTLLRMANQAVKTGLHPKRRVHIFDPHGDLNLPGASEVVFSEQAPFGLNPFRVNPSLEFGGVRKAIQNFISIIDDASRTKLGLKQEAVVRELALDVYREFGFHANDPATWSLNALDSAAAGATQNRIYLNVPFELKDQAKLNGARWAPEKGLWYVQVQHYRGPITQFSPVMKDRVYPTLEDLVNYTRQIYIEKFLGSDQRAMAALGLVQRSARSLQRKVIAAAKVKREYDQMSFKEDEEALDKARAQAVDAYTEYVHSIQSGGELENFTKYQSPEVLQSVSDRLGNLSATGLFKAVPPPFDPNARVWTYKLYPLSLEEKKMMVLFQLTEIFYRAVERGPQSEVVDLVVVDELSSFTTASDAKGEGILSIIARQGRKFGLALWAADQTLEGVPKGLITSCGTKIILGLDEGEWSAATNKLAIEQKLLAAVTPKAMMAVQLKESGEVKARWRWVDIPKG